MDLRASAEVGFYQDLLQAGAAAITNEVDAVAELVLEDRWQEAVVVVGIDSRD